MDDRELAQRMAEDYYNTHLKDTPAFWNARTQWMQTDFKAGFLAGAAYRDAVWEERVNGLVGALEAVWHEGVCAGKLKDKVAEALAAFRAGGKGDGK